MKDVLFLVNPRAGMRRVIRFLPDIIRLFYEKGYRCETFVTGASGEAAQYLENTDRSFDLVVCAGGDGTLNEAVSGMLSAGMTCPLGYIPCGTTNDYASSIGLSSDIMQAARDIMEGTKRAFDVGRFNGRHFVYTATCGAFAKASYTTSQAAKNVLGHMAYVLEGVRDLGNIKPIHMRVDTGKLIIDEDFLFCSITNSTSVGGILKLDSELVSLNDGQFEVTLVRNPINPAQLSTILYGLTSQDIPNEMIYFFSTDKLDIRCDGPIEWTLDGEREGETAEAKLENLHAAIRIMIPNRPESADISHELGRPEV